MTRHKETHFIKLNPDRHIYHLQTSSKKRHDDNCWRVVFIQRPSFEEKEEGPLLRKKMHKILADARTILVLIQEENDPHKTYTFNQSLS